MSCLQSVMALILKVLHEILRVARYYIKRFRFPGRASLLALLGRVCQWWRFWPGYGNRNPAKRPSVGTEASSYSVSGGSAAVAGGYVVAASYVPPSPTSRPSSHERTNGQHLATVPYPVGTHPPVLASATLSVDHPHGHNPQQLLDTRGLANRSSGNLSIASFQSRASSRFSIITTSRESIRDTTHGQPSRLPRATYRQFGRGPDPSRSRERSTRPNTPSSRPRTPLDPTRLEIVTTNPPPVAHGSGRASPMLPPSASTDYTHEPLSPPTIVVGVHNPSTESLPMSPSANNPPITEEPFAVEFATAISSPDSSAVDHHDERVPGSQTLDDYLPEGRSVNPIDSGRIPRYTKNASMQVQYTVLSPHPYISSQTSRGDSL